MISFEDEGTRVTDKLDWKKLNFRSSKWRWGWLPWTSYGIVDEFEEAPPAIVDPKMKKEYQRRGKKAMSNIVLNLLSQFES